MKKLSLICAALLLSACGGSNSGDYGVGKPPTPPGPPDPPAPMVDAFYARVLALVNSSPDDTEPVDVSAGAFTEPDNTEPATPPAQ